MRVRWTVEEREQLISAAAQCMYAKEVFSMRDGLTRAIQTLPKDRRRDIVALTQVPWFTSGVPAKIKELERQKTKTVEQQIDDAASASAKQARAEIEDEIVNWVAKILAKAIRLALEDTGLSRLLQPNEPTITNVRQRMHAAQRERLPRVVIAGMLPSQAKSVEEAFKDKLDLRFWSKDQSADTLKSMLKSANHCIGMVGFLAHSHDAILKSSHVPYTPVSGGVTQIKQALEKVFEVA